MAKIKMSKENVNPSPVAARALSKKLRATLKPLLENSLKPVERDQNNNSYKKIKILATENEREDGVLKSNVLLSNVIPLKIENKVPTKEENDAMESDDETIIDDDYDAKTVTTIDISDSEEVRGVKEEVENDPNFTVICAFLERFGSEIGFKNRHSIPHLKALFEDYSNKVSLPDSNIAKSHLKFLRIWQKASTGKLILTKKWKEALIDFCKEHCAAAEAQELECAKRGYQSLKLSTRLKIFARLLEAMLIYNDDVKAKLSNPAFSLLVHGIPLKENPSYLGCDITGAVYWFQLDSEVNFRLYKEEEKVGRSSWSLVSKSLPEFNNYIVQLSDIKAKQEYIKLLKSSSEKSFNFSDDQAMLLLKNFDDVDDANLVKQQKQANEDVDEKMDVAESSDETADEITVLEKKSSDKESVAEVFEEDDKELEEAAEGDFTCLKPKRFSNSRVRALQERQKELNIVKVLRKRNSDVLRFDETDEFACESEPEDDDGDEKVAVKRARTAKSVKEKQPNVVTIPCKVCRKSDYPQLILLCDGCKDGYHATCLRPMLHALPRTEYWFCPPCEHSSLVKRMNAQVASLLSLLKAKARREAHNEKKNESRKRKLEEQKEKERIEREKAEEERLAKEAEAKERRAKREAMLRAITPHRMATRSKNAM